MKRSGDANSITARLASLGEPVRLRIMRLLESNELSVGEVSRVVQLPQSTVSRHLKVLSEGGWLVRRSEGTATMYRLVLDDLSVNARALWLAVREHMGLARDVAQDRARLASVLAERRADTESFFGRVAGEWDAVRNELFGERFTLHALLSLVPADWTVADLGCGTGNAAELLAPVVKRVVAVDQSRPMLSAAKKRLGDVRNVRFVRGSLESLPLEDESVDATVCVLVLHHLEDPGKACEEMARVLRPGGVALVVDMVEHDRSSYRHTMGHRWLGFGEREVRSAMTRAGLVQPVFRPLASDPGARGPGVFAATAHKPVGKGERVRGGDV